MITAICPYCSNGIDILSDDCLKMLKYKGKISCVCDNNLCGKEFIMQYKEEKMKAIKKEEKVDEI